MPLSEQVKTMHRRLVAIKPGEKMGEILHVCWMLHNACNQRCSYCQDDNRNGTYQWLKFENVRQFMERVFVHHKKDVYHVSFTGGEPTLWPDFPQLVCFLRDRNCQIGLTSNGARRVDYWKNMQKDFNWVCLSYHPEFARDDHFAEVVKTLANHTRLAVRLMMHKEKRFWERSIEFGEKLRSLPNCGSLFVEYVPLQDDFGPDSRPTEYEPWQREIFSKKTHFTVQTRRELIKFGHRPEVWDYYCHYDDGSVEFCRPNDLVAHNQVNFEGWSCHAGQDLLFVNHAGLIYRGCCRQGGQVGHIFDEDLRLPDRPLRCGVSFCPCGTDILVRKSKPA